VKIDLNADAGESFGAWRMGDDERLFEQVTTVNVACGFHAGDPLTIRRTVAAAVRHGLAIGAHPSYPDLVGFGRRPIAATPDQVYADVLYQVGAVDGFVNAAGTTLSHVKTHGALNNVSCRDAQVAAAIAEAVRDFRTGLPLVVLPGTVAETEARRVGVPVVLEAFPERGYLGNGELAPRSMSGAVIHDPVDAARRAVIMARDGRVEAIDGSWFELQPNSLCIHGDNPHAVEIAAAVRAALVAEGIRVVRASADATG
jgi:5-oxoprolinase (ATP-hydrolysing) subunit A